MRTEGIVPDMAGGLEMEIIGHCNVGVLDTVVDEFNRGAAG